MSLMFLTKSCHTRGVLIRSVLNRCCGSIGVRNENETVWRSPLLLLHQSKLSTGTALTPNSIKKRKDQDRVVVYANNNKRYMLVCHVTVTSSILFAAAWSTYLINNPDMISAMDQPINIDDSSIFLILSNTLLVALFSMMNFIRMRSLLKISYDKTKKQFEGDKFDFFLRRRLLIFKPGDATILKHHDQPNQSFLTGLNGNFLIKSKRYFMHMEDFKNPLYYNMMLGMSPHVNSDDSK